MTGCVLNDCQALSSRLNETILVLTDLSVAMHRAGTGIIQAGEENDEEEDI